MKFSLKKNPLYKKEGDPLFIATSRRIGRLTKKQVMERVAYGSHLNEATIYAVLCALEKNLVQYVAMGYRIDLGFISLSTSVRGGFSSSVDSFRKDRNWVKVNVKVNQSFTQEVNEAAKPKMVFGEAPGPKPMRITKIFGDLNNPEFQSGNLVKISGKKLVFDAADLETGVFLKPEAGPGVRIHEYAKTGGTSIMCVIPGMIKPGKHYLEVRSRSKSGNIYIGSLEKPITLAA